MSESRDRRRWWICGLLFGATALSFLDRQVLSVLSKEITNQLGMNNLEYSFVTTAFMMSYAVMFLLGGRVLDLVGTRLGMTLSVGVWSIASALHGAVRNAVGLGACRFLLGIGEGGCFPGAAKGIAENFDPRRRALAMGIAIGGASLGAVLAPPMSYWLNKAITWRGVFLVTGGLGMAWVAAWWILAGPRKKREEIAASAAQTREAAPPEPEERPRLLALLERRDVWGLAAMRFVFDPVFYFYMFWMPKYLASERGASDELVGKLAWIPFLALGISNVGGGWVSDLLIRRGVAALSARRTIMAAAALMTIASSFAGLVPRIDLSLALMALLMLAHGFWITNYVTLISERFPRGAVGTVMGFSGAVGAAGGIFTNTLIGWCVDHFSYGPVWIVSGLMYPAAFGVLLLTVRARGTWAAIEPPLPPCLSQGSPR